MKNCKKKLGHSATRQQLCFCNRRASYLSSSKSDSFHFSFDPRIARKSSYGTKLFWSWWKTIKNTYIFYKYKLWYLWKPDLWKSNLNSTKRRRKLKEEENRNNFSQKTQENCISDKETILPIFYTNFILFYNYQKP